MGLGTKNCCIEDGTNVPMIFCPKKLANPSPNMVKVKPHTIWFARNETVKNAVQMHQFQQQLHLTWQIWDFPYFVPQ